MATKLVGQNYSTPDLVAKVTGKAKYAEDYVAEGMLICRLLTSPLPHARARNIDISAAQAMPGVKAILLPSDIPDPADTVTKAGMSDPVALAFMVLTIGAIAMLACLPPIRRATRVDPIVALRTD